MAISRAKKNEIVQMLDEKLKKQVATVFVGFDKVSVQNFESIRKECRENELEVLVTKKTLFKLACQQNDIEFDLDKFGCNNLSVVFWYDDEILPAKLSKKLNKDFENFRILGWLFEREVVDESKVNQLSSIPSKPELLAKFMGSATSPISWFMGIGKNLMGGFVRCLDGVRKQKS